ncbi:MAG: DUF4443 domain-containing protein [Candidatus Odinarchaeota archaeon]
MDILDVMELIIIKESGRIGRYTLKDALGISEGKTRSMLKKLLNEGLISAGPLGASLTSKGEKELNQKLRELNIKKYLFSPQTILDTSLNHYIFQMVNFQIENTKLIQLRDEAIRGGASSAIFILYNQGKLTVPGVYNNLAEVDEKTCLLLKNNFELSEGDLLIAASSKNRWLALKGCLHTIQALTKNTLR